MALDIDEVEYFPGMYRKKRRSAAQIADQRIREWEKNRLAKIREKALAPRVTSCICLSRKIGVGALEVADLLALQTGFKVADREILEHIASKGNLRETTARFLDESYPGRMGEIASFLFGEKSFTRKDYMRYLSSAAYAFSDANPTIFVGRAIHLILPRERVLAVRLISSIEHRTKRVANILGVSEEIAKERIDAEDKHQREFFEASFGRKDASPYEFDLVINCDFVSTQACADIVRTAYNAKFGNL